MGGYKCQLSVKILAICQFSVNPIQTLIKRFFYKFLPIKKYSLPGGKVVGESAGNRNTKVSYLTFVGESHNISAG